MTDVDAANDSTTAHRIVTDHERGFDRLHPLPSEAEVAAFYEDDYYRLVEAGERAINMTTELAADDRAAREAAWLRSTVHADQIDALRRLAPGARVLEVGGGLGTFARHLVEAGFEVEGIDPAPEAVGAFERLGLVCHQGLLETVGPGLTDRYDAVCLPHVAEMLREPQAAFELVADLLRPAGIVIVLAGNDGNPLQRAAADALDLPDFWMAAPDHLNYFTFDTMSALLDRCGFEVVDRWGDFPMELFLLLGFDYRSEPTLGRECHERRMAFEEAVATDDRRRLYRAFADAGVGRTFTIVARRGDGS
ncbi:MAG: class I SAM-dependent methyltransferase [Actinomycetota bacterium]